MPTLETLDRLSAHVESNAHAEAIEEFCAEDSSMQESQSQPRVGRTANAAVERAVLAKAASVSSTCVRPAFIAADRVALHWIFEFRWHDGTATRMEELA